MNDFLELAVVFVLRMAQAVAVSLPTVLCGMLVAGLLAGVVGRERVRRLLAKGGIGDLFRAWLLGILLPVCGIGVFPVLGMLRRMGVNWGVLGVVAISGPLVTPWTVGYLFERCGLTGAGMVLGANLLLSITLGLVLGGEPIDGTEDLKIESGVLRNAGRSLTGGVWQAMLLTVLGVGVLSVLIPPNWVGESLVERGGWNWLAISGASILSYVSPELMAMQAGEVVNASTMPGLVVWVVALGAGMNLGLLLAAYKVIGGWRTIRTGVLLLILTGAISWGADRVLYDSAWQPDDSHAFEDMGRPYHLLDHKDGAWAGITHRFKKQVGFNAIPAGLGVAGLVLAGRIVKSTRRPPLSNRAWAGLVTTWSLGTAVLGVYGYFPSPDPIAGEMRGIVAEMATLYRHQDMHGAQRLARQLERQLGKYHYSCRLYGRTVPEGETYAMPEAIQTTHRIGQGQAVSDEQLLELQRFVQRLGR